MFCGPLCPPCSLCSPCSQLGIFTSALVSDVPEPSVWTRPALALLGPAVAAAVRRLQRLQRPQLPRGWQGTLNRYLSTDASGQVATVWARESTPRCASTRLVVPRCACLVFRLHGAENSRTMTTWQAPGTPPKLSSNIPTPSCGWPPRHTPPFISPLPPLQADEATRSLYLRFGADNTSRPLTLTAASWPTPWQSGDGDDAPGAPRRAVDRASVSSPPSRPSARASSSDDAGDAGQPAPLLLRAHVADGTKSCRRLDDGQDGEIAWFLYDSHPYPEDAGGPRAAGTGSSHRALRFGLGIGGHGPAPGPARSPAPGPAPVPVATGFVFMGKTFEVLNRCRSFGFKAQCEAAGTPGDCHWCGRAAACAAKGVSCPQT